MTESLAATGACVFDAYGTLFDLTSAARRCAAALGGRADVLSELWRRKQLEYTWLRSLMGSHADFWQVTGESLDYALAALKIDDGSDLRGRLMSAFLTVDAYPDARDALTRLAGSRRPLAILSNGTPAMLSAALDRTGMRGLLDPVLSVEEVGIYKPDPRVYELACRRLNLAPGRICFVSSNGWDVAGAARFGLKAVWVNRARAPLEQLPAAPAAEITGLAELPALLGRE